MSRNDARTRDQRQHRERDAEQLGIQAGHRDHDADQREQVAEQRANTGRHQLVQHVDVTGEARHDAADRMAVEVRHRQRLQLAEQRGAQIQHDALTDALHDLVLQIAQPESDRQQRQVLHRDPVEETQIVAPDAVIDRLLGQPWIHQRDERVADHHDARERHLQPVGPQEAEQPPHQPVVVRATGGFVFLDHEASSSSSSCCARHRSA
jgi:hypothetical protein